MKPEHVDPSWNLEVALDFTKWAHKANSRWTLWIWLQLMHSVLSMAQWDMGWMATHLLQALE